MHSQHWSQALSPAGQPTHALGASSAGGPGSHQGVLQAAPQPGGRGCELGVKHPGEMCPGDAKPHSQQASPVSNLYSDPPILIY